MTTHTTQAPCGCSIVSSHDGDGWRNELQPCPLHGAAEELLEACKKIVHLRDFVVESGGADGALPQATIEFFAMMQIKAHAFVEAALAKAEGR